MPSLADAVGGRAACLTSAVRVPHQAAQSREPLLLDFYLLCLKADHIILRKKRAIKCGLDRGEIIKTYSSVRALKFFFFYDYDLRRETNIGQNTTGFKWLILWNFA